MILLIWNLAVLFTAGYLTIQGWWGIRLILLLLVTVEPHTND